MSLGRPRTSITALRMAVAIRHAAASSAASRSTISPACRAASSASSVLVVRRVGTSAECRICSS